MSVVWHGTLSHMSVHRSVANAHACLSRTIECSDPAWERSEPNERVVVGAWCSFVPCGFRVGTSAERSQAVCVVAHHIIKAHVVWPESAKCSCTAHSSSIASYATVISSFR